VSDRRAQALQQRQLALMLRSAELRQDLAAQMAPLRAPLALADRVREGWRWLRANPEGPIAAAVVITILRPRRAWRWGVRLWWGWRTWRRLQRKWERVSPRA
jgi:hypothetical protein